MINNCSLKSLKIRENLNALPRHQTVELIGVLGQLEEKLSRCEADLQSLEEIKKLRKSKKRDFNTLVILSNFTQLCEEKLGYLEGLNIQFNELVKETKVQGSPAPVASPPKK